MLNIKVLIQLKNYTLIQDLCNNNVYLYSYGKCIAIWDGRLNYDRRTLTTMSKMHLTWFKEYL